MRKSIVLLLVIFISMMASAQFTPSYSSDSFSNTKDLKWSQIPGFLESYNKAVELNRGRFTDVNKIQLGDTVLMPSKSGIGVEAWVADKPVVNKGKDDCIWLINQRYLLGQLKTQPVDTIKIKQVIPGPAVKMYDWMTVKNIFEWLFLLVVVAVILFFIFYVFRYLFFKAANPDADPVIPGGLANEPLVALQQINVAYPNRPRATRVQRVILNAPEGTLSENVAMTFANETRNTILRSGEIATRVEREGGLVDFYRQHCGNLIGEVYQGGYSLPVNWTYTVIEGAEAPVAESAPIVPAVPVTPVSENLTSVSTTSSEDILKVLKSIRKFKARPESITYGGLTVSFKSKTKKEK